ncbi:hypothetical protein [Ectopseudomonas alcaliphila]|uniref:Uncharacterized protein n=1 Tax=Ectopseudomonas alcaliphila TaxID=101564 RepID=A0A1G7MJ76_9GAMM|nr:hypothetical protein [Pseudomonas alcaliphila]MDX5994952.1 hypothetical protein [Pseudomonas alcaliphila]SDF61734.1 hypothetical protein SAMN05216575_10967 [Pseudomonas alcaliphila]
MDSNYPFLGRPLWFGTPWHGAVFSAGGAGTRLRPLGSSGALDRAWLGARYRPAALWDIGRPDVETPAEIAAQGGQFLGRSLQPCDLVNWRPLLLAGVVCRARIIRDPIAGFVLTLRGYDPATGQLLPAVTVNTGSFTNASIGQGAGQPPVSGWTPPTTIDTYSAMDVTPDGRSMLLGVTPVISGVGQVLLGLLRLDIGGTPEAPTLTLSLISSRTDALGTYYMTGDSGTFSTMHLPTPPNEQESGACGITRDYRPGARTLTPGPPSPSNPSPAATVGSGAAEVGVTGRLLTAWFTAGGGVELVRYNYRYEWERTATLTDESTGEYLRIVTYDNECNPTGSTTTDTILLGASLSDVSEIRETITVGSLSATGSIRWTMTGSTIEPSSLPPTWSITTLNELNQDGITLTFTYDFPITPPTAPALSPTHPVLLGVVVGTATDSAGAIYPEQFGWSLATLARTRFNEARTEVQCKRWPCYTPAGLRGDNQFFLTDSPIGISRQSRRVYAQFTAYNPLDQQLTNFSGDLRGQALLGLI